MNVAIKAIVSAALISTAASISSAETAMEHAVHHFNASVDRASDAIATPVTPATIVIASARGASSIDTAMRVFNASAESPSDLIGVNGFTRVDGEPRYGAAIFARLLEESRGQD